MNDPTLHTLAEAARALELGREIDRLDRNAAAMAELPAHIASSADAGIGRTVEAQIEVSLPFGGASIQLHGKPLIALIEAIGACAAEERRVMIEELRSCGFAYAPANALPAEGSRS